MPEPDEALPELLRHPRFVVSAHQPTQWVTDTGAEVAFAGRSNVGKSSAINAITRRRKLARTSKTPGRTQQIVFFELAVGRRLVDLPGYGFAQVPAALKQHWERTIERYLSTRGSLRGLMLVMDARHPLTLLDRQMLHWCARSDMPVHILLTKADKLSYSKAVASLRRVRDATQRADGGATVQLFSATDGSGVEQARERLVAWLE